MGGLFLYSRVLPGTVAEPADLLLRGLYILLGATKHNENAWFYLPLRPLGVQTKSAASRETEQPTKLHPRSRIPAQAPYARAPEDIMRIHVRTPANSGDPYPHSIHLNLPKPM